MTTSVYTGNSVSFGKTRNINELYVQFNKQLHVFPMYMGKIELAAMEDMLRSIGADNALIAKCYQHLGE